MSFRTTLTCILLSSSLSLGAELPPNIKKLVEIYENQKKAIAEQSIKNYVATLQNAQTKYAANKEYEKVAFFQKEIKRISPLTAKKIFSYTVGANSKLDLDFLVGTWVCVSGYDRGVLMGINKDGTIFRNIPGRGLDQYWRSAKVHIKGADYFQLISDHNNCPIGDFYVKDENTLSVYWEGDNIFKRQ